MTHLFARLIDEESKRDAVFREHLIANFSKPNSIRRMNAPPSIQLPIAPPETAHHHEQDDAVTPKAITSAAVTPGLTIGVATPQVSGVNYNSTSQTTSQIPATIEEGSNLEKKVSQTGVPRTSSEKASDYFSTNPQAKAIPDPLTKPPTTPGEAALDASTTASPTDGDKDEKTGSSLFGKKFRMNFPKKLGRSSVEVKPALVDEKSEESDKSDDREDKPIQDNFYGVIQKIQYEYEEQLQHGYSRDVQSAINSGLFSDAPRLHHPPYTTVLIQEERPDAGGAADLYRGTVSSVGLDADLIEQSAPAWLGDLLLRVCTLNMAKSAGTNISAESDASKRGSKGLFRLTSLSGPASRHCQSGWVSLRLND